MEEHILNFFKGNYPKKAIQMLENYFENGFGRNSSNMDFIKCLKIKDISSILDMLSRQSKMDLHIAYMHGLIDGMVSCWVQ